MFQGDSSNYTFNPKTKPQASFATSILNYGKHYEFNNGTQTRKNDKTPSKNPSLDDSEEVTRRMEQLKRSLGLPIHKPKEQVYGDEMLLDKVTGNKEQNFLQGLAKSMSRQKDRDLSDYLNLDEDSVFQTDTKSQPKKGFTEDLSNIQKYIKDQEISPYKLSASENVSPLKEQSFERELGSYGTQGMSFKVYHRSGEKEARQSILNLQKENEILRQQLEEERKLQQDQKEMLNAHLQEFRKAAEFDRESENILKQNIVFYKNQITELENQIVELKTQYSQYQDGDKQCKIREKNYISEIEALKKELLMMHQQDIIAPEGMGPKDTYVKKLEMNIKFLNGQVKELSHDKSQLQTVNENLENEMKTLTDKLYKEIEEKYRKERDEKDFIIKSLKRDFDIYIQNDCDPDQKSTIRKTHKKKLSKLGLEYKKYGGEDDIQSIYARLNELENENFLLKEKLEFLEIQNKGQRNSRETYGSQPNSYETQITCRRIQTLKESVLFWKEKSEKLAGNFGQMLKNLREENEKLKEGLLDKLVILEEETQTIVKKLKNYYKKEQTKILNMVNELEEKHYQNQAKLAEARSKYKNAVVSSYGHPLDNITNYTKKKTKTRNETNNYSP